MKKKFFLHKTLSLVLVLSMLACCTACGCGATFDETESNSATTESGTNNNNTATDGTMNNTTTTDGTMNNSTPTDGAMNNTTESGTTNAPQMSTEQITDGTEGILGDTINGVMDDVKQP